MTASLIRTAHLQGERGVIETAGAPMPLMTLHASGRIGQTFSSGRRSLRRTVGPGDIDLTPAEATGRVEDEGRWSILALAIPNEAVDRGLDEIGLKPRPVEPVFGARDPELERLAWRLHREADGGDALYRQCLGEALVRRVLRLQAPGAHEAPKAKALAGARLRRVLDFIDANLDQPFTVEDLAAQAGLGQTAFKAAFRRAFDAPVHRYVVRRRGEHARLLLLEGDLAPSQIALEAGFSHQTHMARWLRRLFGVLPSELASRTAAVRPGG